MDSAFYRKFAPVPLNIVLYNVFSGPGRGPDIYGTEPWHFYARNLFLNFHVWFLLALISLPLLLLQRFVFRQSPAKQPFRRTLFGQAPFYLWFVIMTLQPHKEERFMYPLYPALALNAAVSVHVVLAHVGHPSPGSMMWRVPAWLKFLVAVAFGLAAV
ncbi:MAG: hypothetical protein INR71_13750, partial [Terriglobus roseus]|nr:hypothetical protein [Terriglobus roseus]